MREHRSTLQIFMNQGYHITKAVTMVNMMIALKQLPYIPASDLVKLAEEVYGREYSWDED